VSRVTALRALWRADRERSRVLKDLPGLIEQPSSALSAARLAAEIGSPAVLSVPELTERLADLPWSPIPARALGAIGAPASSALPALRRAMASATAAARVAAAWAVWRISSDAARPIDALSDVARLSGEADEEAAWSAVSTLAGLAAEEVAARECLERLSLDAPWPTRTAARRALDLLLQN
jgi:hypothetical protein